MANPNMLNVTVIKGENSFVNLDTTLPTLVVSNAANSGKIYKINSLVVSNVDGETAANITIACHSSELIGGDSFPLCYTISVPADASLIVIDKSTAFYLKENQSISATAGTANDLVVIASWEEIEV